jgi:hypothetical protein
VGIPRRIFPDVFVGKMDADTLLIAYRDTTVSGLGPDLATYLAKATEEVIEG